MKKYILLPLLLVFSFSCMAQLKIGKDKKTAPQIKLGQGVVEGVLESSGIVSFKGIPYAQPPVGELRWREPQPPQPWQGVLKADKFRNKPMQKPIFSDMNFRSATMSEDCLYLNIWTPAKKPSANLPVLVYFHGGGYIAGDGSEYRYDGESMAKMGIVTITVNYRLGIFGFFAHPDLTKESPNNASGNYGLLDQNAALLWVKKNIAAFGGDPNKITIAGESAGSISVSAHMASPLSKNLIAGAIGQSGAMINPTQTPISFEDAQNNGISFATAIKVHSVQELRRIPAEQLLNEAYNPGNLFPVKVTIDNYFLKQSPQEVFAAGNQSDIPLLAGWTSSETPYMAFMQGEYPNPVNYEKKVRQIYGDKSSAIITLYPGATENEVIASATALASDCFIVYSTWKWAELHRHATKQPVYVYTFSRPRPVTPPAPGTMKQNTIPQPMAGAAHASDIEYALGNLATNKVYAWTADDFNISLQMQTYFANFIKTGNPNGKALPQWPASPAGADMNIMEINAPSKVVTERHRERYLFLEQYFSQNK
jgi:para-nitrobenzyl esterase